WEFCATGINRFYDAGPIYRVRHRLPKFRVPEPFEFFRIDVRLSGFGAAVRVLVEPEKRTLRSHPKIKKLEFPFRRFGAEPLVLIPKADSNCFLATASARMCFGMTDTPPKYSSNGA